MMIPELMRSLITIILTIFQKIYFLVWATSFHGLMCNLFTSLGFIWRFFSGIWSIGANFPSFQDGLEILVSDQWSPPIWSSCLLSARLINHRCPTPPLLAQQFPGWSLCLSPLPSLSSSRTAPMLIPLSLTAIIITEVILIITQTDFLQTKC